MTKLVEISNVKMTYQSLKGEKIDALESTNLEINEGEFVSLLGPSGCGKTTLLNIIGGLIRPTEGEIHIDGQLLTKPRPDLLSFVFQEPTLLPWRTVLKNVEFVLEVRKAEKQERNSTATKYLQLVGIDQFKQHFPHELSGGMRQRVALARALSLETKIILMDEPFGALDEQSRTLLGNELARIQAKARKAIIFVTHSIEEALYLSDRVVVMSRRPGTIMQIIDVKFDKPRDPSLRVSFEFSKLKADVWKLLESQVDQTIVR